MWEVGLLPKTINEFFITKGKIKTVIIVHGAGGNHELIKDYLKAIRATLHQKTLTLYYSMI
jgi:hypothetical protein